MGCEDGLAGVDLWVEIRWGSLVYFPLGTSNGVVRCSKQATLDGLGCWRVTLGEVACRLVTSDGLVEAHAFLVVVLGQLESRFAGGEA